MIALTITRVFIRYIRCATHGAQSVPDLDEAARVDLVAWKGHPARARTERRDRKTASSVEKGESGIGDAGRPVGPCYEKTGQNDAAFVALACVFILVKSDHTAW